MSIPRQIKHMGETGETTGASYPCRLEGCAGIRITTRWPDGHITHPCSKGMIPASDDLWIIPG